MITAFTAQKFDYKCQHFFLVSGRCVLCIFRPAAQRLRDRTAESPHTRSRASGTSSAKFPQLPMDCSFQFVTQDACLSFFRSLSLSGSWPCGLAIYKQTCNTCRHISLSLLCLPVCVCVWGCPSTPRLSPSHSCLLMSSPATNRQKDTNSWLRLNGNCETVVGRSLAAISFPLPQCTSMRECVHTCVCV